MKNIHVSRLSSEVLDEIFSRAKHQVDYIIALYRHCVPNFDRITTVENTPRCSKKTWLEICRRAQAFDTQHHKKVLPGGCWMNSGFSTGFSFEGKEYKLPYMTVVWEMQPDVPKLAPLSREEIRILGQYERDLESAYEAMSNDEILGVGSDIHIERSKAPEVIAACSLARTAGYNEASVSEDANLLGVSLREAILRRFILRLYLNLTPRIVHRHFRRTAEEYANICPPGGISWMEWIYNAGKRECV